MKFLIMFFNVWYSVPDKKNFWSSSIKGGKNKKGSVSLCWKQQLNTGEKLSSTPLSPSPPPEPKDAQRLHLLLL